MQAYGLAQLVVSGCKTWTASQPYRAVSLTASSLDAAAQVMQTGKGCLLGLALSSIALSSIAFMLMFSLCYTTFSQINLWPFSNSYKVLVSLFPLTGGSLVSHYTGRT